MIGKVSALVVVALVVTSPALAADYKYMAKAGDHQTVEYQQGNGIVYSKLDHSEVDISYAGDFPGKRAKFLITIVNNGQDNINVDIANLSATYANQPLHIYTASELVKIVNGRAGWATFAIALAGGLDAAAASTPSTSTTYGHVGGTSFGATTTTYSTNYYAQAAAQDRTDRNLNELRSAHDASVDQINTTALQLTTVKPGQPYVSKICIDRPKELSGGALEIEVAVSGEVHKFDFDVSKQ